MLGRVPVVPARKDGLEDRHDDRIKLPHTGAKCGLARDVSKDAIAAQLEMLGARSAEELAAAIAKFHGVS